MSATKLAGVVGWPVQHSLSPRLHGHWLREYGIDGAYAPLPVAREDFSHALDGLRRAGLVGVNVTIPHKQAAFSLAQDVDDTARRTGAVNLLLFAANDEIHGRNTDVQGLCASIRDELGAEIVKERTAVVLGAGGAARAAVLALAQLGAAEIRIVNRTEARAKTLALELQPHIEAPLSSAEWPEAARGAALLANATSGGMTGAPPLELSLDALPQTAAICDLIYNPLETELLKRARARGHRAINGLGMLMHQAAPAFEALFGIRPQVTLPLRRDLEQALEK